MGSINEVPEDKVTIGRRVMWWESTEYPVGTIVGVRGGELKNLNLVDLDEPTRFGHKRLALTRLELADATIPDPGEFAVNEGGDAQCPNS